MSTRRSTPPVPRRAHCATRPPPQPPPTAVDNDLSHAQRATGRSPQRGSETGGCSTMAVLASRWGTTSFPRRQPTGLQHPREGDALQNHTYSSEQSVPGRLVLTQAKPHGVGAGQGRSPSALLGSRVEVASSPAATRSNDPQVGGGRQGCPGHPQARPGLWVIFSDPHPGSFWDSRFQEKDCAIQAQGSEQDRKSASHQRDSTLVSRTSNVRSSSVYPPD